MAGLFFTAMAVIWRIGFRATLIACHQDELSATRSKIMETTNFYLPHLKSQREATGWTQDMLSEASGISVRTIQRIEAGGKTSLETAKSFAATFNLPSYESLQDVGEDKSGCETSDNESANLDKNENAHNETEKYRSDGGRYQGSEKNFVVIGLLAWIFPAITSIIDPNWGEGWALFRTLIFAFSMLYGLTVLLASTMVTGLLDVYLGRSYGPTPMLPTSELLSVLFMVVSALAATILCLHPFLFKS